MIGRGLDGSAVKYIQALSAGDFDAKTCTAAFDLSKFDSATLLVLAGSVNTGAEFVVQRSATSAGTFAAFGASIGTNAGCKVLARSFGVGTSNIWHRVYVDNGTGSATAGVALIGHGARVVPVDQDTNTTVHSYVVAAK